MKKIFYIVLWIFLGLILSFIAHAIIEMAYLNWADKNGVTVNWILNGACALPLWLFILLPIFGIIFGIWAGTFFWQKVYIEAQRDKHSDF